MKEEKGLINWDTKLSGGKMESAIALRGLVQTY